MKTLTAWLMVLVIWVTIVKAQSLSDGMKALDYENYTTAKNIFKKLIAQQPAEGKNYYYLGIAYDNLGKFDSARMAYNAGMQADPKTIHNFIGMGRSYLDENNTQKATEFFDRARSMTTSKDISFYVLLADAYINSEHPNPQEAINQLNKAITFNNKVADVYWELGQAYESVNKGGDAVSAFERCAELDPGAAKAYTRIGNIWRLARNYNQSLTNFQKALQIDPNFPPAYRHLAELYYNTAQYDKAKSTFQQYLNLADKNENTDYTYAQYLFLSKDYKNAVSLLDELQKKINTPVVWRLLAYSNFEVGNYPAGLAAMDTFFKKTDPSKILSSDYEYYGKLLGKTGNDSMAVIYLQKAITLDSTKYALYNEEGNILFQDKKYHDAALAYLEKIKASQKDATLQDYFNEGKSYYFSQEYSLSDSAFAGMTRLNKAWPIGYLWQARVQIKLDSPNPDSSKGFAAPFYHMVIATAMAVPDTSKYDKELKESYQYLAYYNTSRENYGASLYYFDCYLKYDPTNTEVIDNMKLLKGQYKNPSISTVPMGKINDTLTIPVSINGNNFDFMYNPITPGLVISATGYSTLFGVSPESGTMMKMISAKISDHTAKSILVIVDPNQQRSMVMGGMGLNQFNIVPDYKTNSLLLR